MKHVYPTDRIAHLWAHQSQESARNQQGNLYFEGKTIYSYGRHFPMATLVTNARGQEAVLLTLDGSSITTSRHLGEVRQATQHMNVIRAHTVTSTVKETLADFDRHIASAQRECFGPSGRFRSAAWKDLELLIGQANAYAEFFGPKRRWTLPTNTEEVRAEIAKAEARHARQVKAVAKAQAQREAQREARQAEALARWVAGEDVSYSSLPRYGFASLRIVGDEVQTSQGASVSIADARRGLRFVRHCRNTATPYQRNGHTLRLGEYPIDSVDAEGNLHAGCHQITIAEIERIAPMLEVR